MEEHEYNRAMNCNFLKSIGTLNITKFSANVPAKLSARDSYTNSSDSADDFSNVFGGPPKYIALKRFKDPRKAYSLLQPSVGVSGLVQSEVSVFGETRRRYVNDEFYNDIFSGDKVYSGGEISGKSSRSTSRNPSPAQTPLPGIEYKTLANRCRSAPKLRQPVNTPKQSEHPSFGISSHRGPSKFYNDSSIVSIVQSSPPDPSSDLLEIPSAHWGKPSKILSEGKQGLKKKQEISVLPPRSSNSFLEASESIPGSSARLSNVKLYSTAQTTPCSNTSDDEFGGNIQGLDKHRSGGFSKLAEEKHGSDCAEGSNSREKDDNGFEKSPLPDLQLQHKLRSCRDWFSESKGLDSNKKTGSLSVDSLEFFSTREIHSKIGISNTQEVSQEIGTKQLSTNDTDSGEESDELGSYVIEIDSKRGETIVFLPERHTGIDTSNAHNLLISSMKETMESAKQESLPNRPRKHWDRNIKGSKLRLHSLLQETCNFDLSREARMQTFQTNKGKGRGREYSKMPPKPNIPETSPWPTPTPAVKEQNAKEDLITEIKMAAPWDPYSIDPSTMVKEVTNGIKKWHHEQPVVFQEMPLASERQNYNAATKSFCQSNQTYPTAYGSEKIYILDNVIAV
ncbi:uncharacterized protein LOC131074501 isoform X1 [Cryptomeria japonica]|uniref:uncharacterized protein LOC131074501 isoform X1 n=1 Tax=Cryptomeria japonica TaxID=3369 RepID=UPI0027D9D4B6|nr:uncharacterized protein LOC131074501 isoform X1 [Cryptomeria japonica]XP_059067398.1 uncharacterized protein LOC131074501 isoform X1 [Cryptomeria japonica]